MHNLETEEDLKRMLAPGGPVKAAEEFRKNGHVRFIGVSGHYFPDAMSRALDEYPFTGVLCPLGALNAVANSFEEKVAKKARARGIAVMGMKVLASGLASREQAPDFLRYALGLDLDTAVVGAETIEQVEENVRTAAEYAPLSEAERKAALEQGRLLLASSRPEAFWLAENYRKK